MTCNILLFKNTGFDLVNIPDSANLVLNNFPYITANFVYLKQNIELTKIKIEKNYEDLKDIDYCVIGEVFYFVTGILMLNNNVCEISLKEDSLTTLSATGGYEILDGWCTRKHVNEDVIFENNIPEDFQPALPFVTENYRMAHTINYNNSINLVLSTVDLTSTDLLKAEVFVGDSTQSDYTVTVPKLPPIANETIIGMHLYNGLNPSQPETIETKYPNIGIFDFDNIVVQSAIRTLRSLGLESVIVGCYKVPTEYIFSIIRESELEGSQFYGRINSIISDYNYGYMVNVEDGLTNLDYIYTDYIPQNKKVFSQFNNFTIFSPTSGDSHTFEMKDVFFENSSLDFILTPDISTEGAPVCKPKYINKQTTHKYNWFLDSVRGSNWLNTPITMREASGNGINSANYAITKAQGQANWDRQQFKTDISPLSNLFGNLGAISGAVSSKGEISVGGMLGAANTNLQWDVDENARRMQDAGREYQVKTLAFETTQNIVPPSIVFPQNFSLQMYYGNIFYATTLRLHIEDLKRFDKYLTRYGYKVSEPLTKETFFGREYFNFVEAIGVTIVSDSSFASRERRINAAKQLEGGVRFWHVVPSIKNLYKNPII